MARTEATLSCFMLAQDFLAEHWAWSDVEKASLGDIKAMGDIIKQRLITGGCEIAEMYGIKHDKDEHRLWDEYQMVYTLSFTANHGHFICRFGKGKGTTLSNIAKLIGIEPNYIEKPRTTKYAFDNMLAYLTHIKYADKYQYDPHLVVTLVGRDYMEHYRERHEAWMQGRAKLIVKSAQEDLDSVLARIVEDENFGLDEIVADATYRKIYILNQMKIDRVLETREFANNRLRAMNREVK